MSCKVASGGGSEAGLDLSRVVLGRLATPRLAIQPCQVGGFEAETQALFDEMSVPPEGVVAQAYDDLIFDLKASGVWDKLSILYIPTAVDPLDARINVKDPTSASTRASVTGSPSTIHVPNIGWEHNSISGTRLGTGLNFNQLPGWSADSISLAAYDTGTVSVGNETLFDDNVGGNTTLIALSPNGVPRFRLRSTTLQERGGTVLNQLAVLTRFDASTVHLSLGGDTYQSNAGPGATAVNSDNTPMTTARGATHSHKTRLSSFGTALSQAEATAYAAAVQAFMTALDAYVQSVDAVIDAMTVPPTSIRRATIETLHAALKADGIFAKCELIYVTAAHDEQAARINWKNPQAYPLVSVNAPAFTVDQGFKGNGSSSYLTTGSTASLTREHGVNFQQNAAHLSVWVRDAINSNGVDISSVDPAVTARSYIQSRRLDAAEMRTRVNYTATQLDSPVTNSIGFSLANRSGASALQNYKDGASVGTGTTASTAIGTTERVHLLGDPLINFSPRQVAFASLGGTLNATEVAAFYNSVRDYLLAVGGAELDPDAEALFDEMDVEPSIPRKVAIDALIKELKAGGVWTKLDVLYLLAAHDEQAARLNWRAPTLRTLTATGGPTFTTDQGYAGDGVDAELVPGVNMNALGSFAQNSGHVAVWSRSDVANNSFGEIGGDGDGLTGLALRSAGGSATWRVNAGADSQVAVADSLGLFVANRSGASATELYKDGALVASDTTASSAVGAVPLKILKAFGGFTGRELALASAGASLTAQEVAVYQSAVSSYLSVVGSLTLAAESSTLIAAMTSAPSAYRKGTIDALITALKTAGVWTALDMLYVMAAHHEQAGRLNWLSPSTDTLATGPSNVAPTFTANRGYSGAFSTPGAGFTTGRAETGLVKALSTDCHLMTRALVNQSPNLYSRLLYGSLTNFQLCPRTNGTFNFPLFAGFTSSSGAIGTDFGNATFCVGTRTGGNGAGVTRISINGAAGTTVGTGGAAIAKSGAIMRFGHPQPEHGGGNPWDGAMFSVGGFLTDAQIANYYRVTQAYLQLVDAI